MSYLEYVDDDCLRDLIKQVLIVGRNRISKSEKDFSKNVIDPFGAIFEASAFEVGHKEWKGSEMIRQSQKTLQNHIGDLHQKILGSVDGWEDLGVGGIVDLVNHEKKIIAEVKNKYNTVTGGKLADQYYSLERLVSLKTSVYKGYTAYFVNVIPKKPERYSLPFQPSDKDKGMKCAENEFIRIIDGASFYSLVSGRDDALREFHSVIPEVIEDIFQHDFGEKMFKIKDANDFMNYFKQAYEK